MSCTESSPQVSVIVPTFQDWPALKCCLAHLRKQDIDTNTFEIIIANNNSCDVIPDDMDLPINARVIWEGKPGSYAARNTALSHAMGEFIFFTDSDCLPNSDWLSSGLKIFQTQKDISRCSGAIEIFPLSGTWNACSLHDSLYCLQQEKFARSGRAATANVAARKTVFSAVGAFRESTFSGGDMEWNARAQNAGFPLQYAPEMIIRHPARDRFSQHALKMARKVGAQFVQAEKTHPYSRCIPPIKNLFPSMGALRTALSAKEQPLSLRLGAWGVHYCLRWVGIIELMRLGFFGKTAERS